MKRNQINQFQLMQLVRLLTRGGREGGVRRWAVLLLAAVIAYVMLRPVLERQFNWDLPDILTTGSPPAGHSSEIETPTRQLGKGEQEIIQAFEARRSNMIVAASAVVEKLLPDDTIGDQHQKMILRLSSGHSLLLAHNIDLAPRVPAREGDRIEFQGEYEYSEQGGVIHWTHHDPAGRHEDGWIRYRGKLYQ